MTRGHRQIEHTADLALEVWAATEEELLEEGARAIVELLVEGAVVAAVVERALEPIDAPDREARLVEWLNQVLYLAVVEGFLVEGCALELAGRGHLEGRLAGEADAAARVVTELKAVTYHELVVAERDEGWFARFVIDV